MPLISLTLADLSDRELLLTLEDVANDEGWATSAEVAEKLGIDNPNPAQCVGSRLGWLKRFKIPMENEIKEGENFWRLPDEAIAILHPKKMAVAAQRALDDLSETQRVQVTEMLAREAARGSVPIAHMTRRAWNHSMGTWRDPSLSAGPKKKK